MAIEIKTTILIRSTPEKVWSVLTNFNNYPTWNPFIISLTGDVKVGNTITVKIKPPDMGSNTFKPKVTAFEPGKKLSWIGVLLTSWIFAGEHIFELIDNNDGTILFVQRENFTGILVPLFKKQLNNNTKSGFEAMNVKLKALTEQK